MTYGRLGPRSNELKFRTNVEHSTHWSLVQIE